MEDKKTRNTNNENSKSLKVKFYQTSNEFGKNKPDKNDKRNQTITNKNRKIEILKTDSLIKARMKTLKPTNKLIEKESIFPDLNNSKIKKNVTTEKIVSKIELEDRKNQKNILSDKSNTNIEYQNNKNTNINSINTLDIEDAPILKDENKKNVFLTCNDLVVNNYYLLKKNEDISSTKNIIPVNGPLKDKENNLSRIENNSNFLLPPTHLKTSIEKKYKKVKESNTVKNIESNSYSNQNNLIESRIEYNNSHEKGIKYYNNLENSLNKLKFSRNKNYNLLGNSIKSLKSSKIDIDDKNFVINTNSSIKINNSDKLEKQDSLQKNNDKSSEMEIVFLNILSKIKNSLLMEMENNQISNNQFYYKKYYELLLNLTEEIEKIVIKYENNYATVHRNQLNNLISLNEQIKQIKDLIKDKQKSSKFETKEKKLSEEFIISDLSSIIREIEINNLNNRHAEKLKECLKYLLMLNADYSVLKDKYDKNLNHLSQRDLIIKEKEFEIVFLREKETKLMKIMHIMQKQGINVDNILNKFDEMNENKNLYSSKDLLNTLNQLNKLEFKNKLAISGVSNNNDYYYDENANILRLSENEIEKISANEINNVNIEVKANSSNIENEKNNLAEKNDSKNVDLKKVIAKSPNKLNNMDRVNNELSDYKTNQSNQNKSIKMKIRLEEIDVKSTQENVSSIKNVTKLKLKNYGNFAHTDFKPNSSIKEKIMSIIQKGQLKVKNNNEKKNDSNSTIYFQDNYNLKKYDRSKLDIPLLNLNNVENSIYDDSNRILTSKITSKENKLPVENIKVAELNKLSSFKKIRFKTSDKIMDFNKTTEKSEIKDDNNNKENVKSNNFTNNNEIKNNINDEKNYCENNENEIENILTKYDLSNHKNKENLPTTNIHVDKFPNSDKKVIKSFQTEFNEQYEIFSESWRKEIDKLRK